MNIGIVAGGFKPFTSGHFAKIALSIQECDKTILLYSAAGRSRGGGISIDSKQIKKMWSLLTPELYEVFRDRIIVKDASPWPVAAVYGIIKCSTRSIKHPIISERHRAKIFLECFEIQDVVSHITIYGSAEDLYKRFICHVENGDSHKMFDDFYDQGRLSFSDGRGRLEYAIKPFYPGLSEADLGPLIAVKGTEVRNKIASDRYEDAIRFLPPILSDRKSYQLLDIFRS